MMKKYRAASPWMAGSAFIHAGMRPLSESVSTVNSDPEAMQASTDCAAARDAFSNLRAPYSRAI